MEADAAIAPNPMDVQADAAVDLNPSDVQADKAMDPLEWAAQRSPAVVAEVLSSPEASKQDLAKEQLQDRLRALKQKMALKREDTQLVPAEVLDQAANRLKALPSSEVLSVCSQSSLYPALHRAGPLASHSGESGPSETGVLLSHDTKPGVIVSEDAAEQGRLFRRPSASDLEGLRCNLATRFAAEAATDARGELQVIARPLASSKMGSILGPGTQDSNPDLIPEPLPVRDVCVPSKETSAPDRCVASEKTSTPDACVASQNQSKKPRRDSQQDSGPSKIPKLGITTMCEATSTPEPVKVSQKDPLPELSDGDAAGSAADIPEVPESFTRVDQRKLRRNQVAAQRKRKHGEDEPEAEAEGECHEEAPEPRGRQAFAEPSHSRSPVAMKRPAAKGQVSKAAGEAKAAGEVPKKAAGPKTKPRAASEVPKKAASPKTKPRAASEAAGREGGSVNDLLKLVLQGLPLLKAQTADMVKKRPDYNSRD
ncbi:unnamed protein product, partial [Symbiodinium sp. CCMP2456]